MMRNKIIAIVLSIALCFSLIFTPQKAYAWTDAIHGAVTALSGLFTGGGTWAHLGTDVAKFVSDHVQQIAATGIRIGLLFAVQAAADAFMDQGDPIIRDYNNYLYIAPQQRAMAEMNNFFNTVSRGRLSRLNYEGIGPNYDAYLVAQARQAIGGQNFTTNIQDQVLDPSQLFSTGNMKGIMSYMQCANNVACYTLTASSKYDQEFAKAQDIAKNEQQNGFLPQKKNGRITSPASLAQSALTQVDQLGTQMIMNAPATYEGIGQMTAGAGISLLSRFTAYETADAAGKEALKNKNDQFPFSLSYSSNGGVGISAGGATINTGMAAFNGNVQLGNTCASGSFSLNAQGAAVDVHGNKMNCVPPKSNSTIQGPAVTGNTGTVTVNDGNGGSASVGGVSGSVGVGN